MSPLLHDLLMPSDPCLHQVPNEIILAGISVEVVKVIVVRTKESGLIGQTDDTPLLSLSGLLVQWRGCRRGKGRPGGAQGGQHAGDQRH